MGADPISIREALPPDGPALMQAIEQINRETEYLGKPEERLPWADRAADTIGEMRQRGSGAYLLALRDGTIVGYLGAFAGWLERTRGAIFIGHVGLREQERGRGIGGRLFAAIEDWAVARKARRLELRVDEANRRGRALYTRQGFVVEGRIAAAARLADGWHAHLWMAKTLTELAEPPWPGLDPRPSGGGVDLRRIEFRAVRPEDAAALRRWERQLLGETPFNLKQTADVVDEARMAAQIGEGRAARRLMWAAFTAAPGGEQVVGYVGGWPQPGERMRHDAFVAINVLRDYWGCGIGRSLLERALVWARTQGIRRLSAGVQGHNRRGLRFAGAAGFEPEVVSPRYAVIDGRAVDHIRLGKLLDER